MAHAVGTVEAIWEFDAFPFTLQDHTLFARERDEGCSLRHSTTLNISCAGQSLAQALRYKCTLEEDTSRLDCRTQPRYDWTVFNVAIFKLEYVLCLIYGNATVLYDLWQQCIMT